MGVSRAVTTLCGNPNDVFLDVSKLLLTYADNILRHPEEDKYRSIRISHTIFTTKLLPIKGAVECLFEMGFEEGDTHLVFPKSAPLDQLKIISELILKERNQRLGGTKSSPVSGPVPSPAGPVPGSLAAPARPSPLPSSQRPLGSSMGLLVTLQSNFQHVLLYEKPELQLEARHHIPHEELTAAAQQKLNKAKEADQECRLGMEDLLVLELLRWFKQDFFSWVDCLPCSDCGGQTQNAGSLSPSTDDVRWGAQRVENHFCPNCRLSTRFPRYNNPEKLLETRRGRCGEWANCFTLCCRALGLEARYVWDSTDHVWTEIYSEAQQRWLHCDACENVCDKPLLYEVGWGKKLAYVLAFSKEQVVDVTWRYSCKHTEVLSRRTSVREAWLVHTINRLNTSRQQYMGAERKKRLNERLIVELVEFISPKEVNPGELGGRNSGSLAWRMARGERRADDPTVETGDAGFVFTPNEEEKRNQLVHVHYSATKDQYCRVSRSSEVTKGWDQCVWRRDGVFRKVESDWQMVYLAREEASATGRISWKFDFAPAGMSVKLVSIMASCKSFHSARVCWHVEAGETHTDFSGDGMMHPVLALTGCSDFTITAELSGGEGEASWQHAQLFRQSLSEDVVSFEIYVQLQDA